MLVISRKLGEAITVGECVVKVLGIRGSRVRVGITAPFDYEIRRPDRKQPPETPVQPNPAPIE